MELPPLSGRQCNAAQEEEIARLRSEVEETHKARSLFAGCRLAAYARTPQFIQQLSTEKVRISATAGDLVRLCARCAASPV